MYSQTFSTSIRWVVSSLKISFHICWLLISLYIVRVSTLFSKNSLIIINYKIDPTKDLLKYPFFYFLFYFILFFRVLQECTCFDEDSCCRRCLPVPNGSQMCTNVSNRSFCQCIYSSNWCLPNIPKRYLLTLSV